MRSSNRFFKRKPRQIPPLSIRVSRDLKEDVGFQKRYVLSSKIVSIPLWLLMRPVVFFFPSWCWQSWYNIPAEIHKYRFYELCDQYAGYCRIYTDGSKVGDRSSAIVYKGITKSVRLPDLTSIFRAELYALFLAIYVIRRSKLEKIVIFSDSLSCLQAIHGFNIDNDLVQKFIKDYSVQTKHMLNHRLMMDSKSCRYSSRREGWFCCKRWPFSHYNCTKISTFWTTTTRNKTDIWEMAKIVEQQLLYRQ